MNQTELERIGRELLVALGEDPTRPGLHDTPRRFARAWREFIEYQPGTLDTTFEAVSSDQMVAVSGVRVWSVCEHHLLPFWCDLTMAYLTNERVIGLSKFARLAHHVAHRLQLQERLAEEVADGLERLSASDDVAVIARGQHLCMLMRGIRTSGLMTTSVLRGRFRSQPTLRAELLALKE